MADGKRRHLSQTNLHIGRLLIDRQIQVRQPHHPLFHLGYILSQKLFRGLFRRQETSGDVTWYWQRGQSI
jgi:hypothetical protein